MEYLNSRVVLLESELLPQQSGQHAASYHERIASLSLKLATLTKSIPNFPANFEQSKLFASAETLGGLQEKANELLATRESIEKSIAYLQFIDLHKGVIDQDLVSSDALQLYEKRLAEINLRINSITVELESQSRQLDNLLETYEAMIIRVSSTFSRWDATLRTLEDIRS